MTIARTEWIWPTLAVAVGLLAAVVALHTDNLQFAVLFLLVQSAVFGYARPERAWRWACLIAVWVPLSLLFNSVVALPSPRHERFGLLPVPLLCRRRFQDGVLGPEVGRSNGQRK